MCSISCCSCCPCYGPSAQVAPAPASSQPAATPTPTATVTATKPVTPVMPNRRVSQVQQQMKEETQQIQRLAAGQMLEVVPQGTPAVRTLTLMSVVVDAHLRGVTDQVNELLGDK